jgi:hypothetical protein
MNLITISNIFFPSYLLNYIHGLNNIGHIHISPNNNLHHVFPQNMDQDVLNLTNLSIYVSKE